MKSLILILLFIFGTNLTAQQVFWQEYATGFTNMSTGVGQISYADANTVWIYATNNDGTGGHYQLFGRSLDSGHTWTKGPINIGSVNLGIASIHAMSATTAYCAVFPLDPTVQGGIFRTVDSGVSWQKQPSASFNTGLQSFANLVHFFDNSNGVAQGDPASGYFEIYTTIDGGTNWVRVPSANIPAPLPSEYGIVHNYETVGSKIWFGTNQGRIFISDDMGYTWTVVQSPITDFDGVFVNARFAMKDQMNGIMITHDYEFYRTNNGGMTWMPEIPSGAIRNYDVAYVPGTANTYFCTGEDIFFGTRGSSYSIDGGATWIDINNFDVMPVDWGKYLACYDRDHALASGLTASATVGGIYELIGGNLKTTAFKTSGSFTAVPNPTSGNVEISGDEITEIIVYDILGKQLLQKKYNSPSKISLDLQGFDSGMYLFNVVNEAGTKETFKIVKQ